MAKILLVEDDKSLREIYGVRLYAEGYDIVSAADGEEALAMAIKERPQLILSDVMMPKISGFDMLDILRSTTETRDIKVIMMTALSSEDQRARGVALGADRYLVKSQVGIEDVVRTVHEILGDTDSVSPQQHSAPAPQTSAPVAQPVYENTAVAQASPQPTAPTTLADRVIQPLNDPESSRHTDMSQAMAKELDPTPPVPGIVPMPSPNNPPMPTAVPNQYAASPVSSPLPTPSPMPQPSVTNPAPQPPASQI